MGLNLQQFLALELRVTLGRDSKHTRFVGDLSLAALLLCYKVG
jgi:hypothetical protein